MTYLWGLSNGSEELEPHQPGRWEQQGQHLQCPIHSQAWDELSSNLLATSSQRLQATMEGPYLPARNLQPHGQM